MKITKNLIMVAFTIFYFINVAIANPENLFKKYADAVVKIEIYRQGLKVNEGAGFFVSESGEIVTNRHVLSGIFRSGFSAKIILRDGTIHNTIEVGNCSDHRNLDICLFRLKDFKPKSWIAVDSYTPNPGEQVVVLGHPNGFEWSITDGVFSAIRENKRESSTDSSGNVVVMDVQISAPISPGNSGGPILNKDGKLIGVATWIKLGKAIQNLNFGIATVEIKNYLQNFKEKYKTYISLEEYRKNLINREKQMGELYKKEILDPAYDEIDAMFAGKKAWELKSINPSYFRPKEFSGHFFNYNLLLPRTIRNCTKEENTSTIITYRCEELLQEGFILISFIKTAADMFEQFNGKQDFEKNPLDIVKEEIKKGTWEATKKNLTPSQLKYLYTFMVAPAKCEKQLNKKQPTVKRQGLETVCTANLYNDHEPDAISFTSLLQFQDRKEVVKLTYWAPHWVEIGHYIHSRTIGTLTLERNAQAKPPLPTGTDGLQGSNSNRNRSECMINNANLYELLNMARQQFGFYPSSLKKISYEAKISPNIYFGTKEFGFGNKELAAQMPAEALVEKDKFLLACIGNFDEDPELEIIGLDQDKKIRTLR